MTPRRTAVGTEPRSHLRRPSQAMGGLTSLVIGWLVAVGPSTATATPRKTGLVVIPAASAPIDVVPNTIFVNRCVGGCTIKFGTIDDARTHTSTIPTGGTHAVTEFAWGDAEWAEVLQCMKDVYSPYAVTVTDVQPAPTVDYNEAIVAGTAQEIGVSSDFSGFAPIMANCNPVDHAISFSFANMFTDPFERAHEICWTAAQEVGHTYGLDHAFERFDGVSACNDPMTYRSDCGGQKFFRDEVAKCGEYEARPCRCSNQQNSHEWLSTVIGEATSNTAPTVSVLSPVAGAAIANGSVIHALAGAPRGVETVELWLNGYRWLSVPGAAFGPTGQPTTDYPLTLPAEVPDGVIDIVVVAKDDLDVATTATTVTVTKGAPCETADTCAAGQHCEVGKCFWDPPTGVTGDACEYDQFCANARCDTIDGESFCTEDCRGSGTSTCPEGLECLNMGNGGRCWLPDSSGCCSSGRGTPWAPLAFGALVLGLAVRRRR
ncbi:MAG: hypothetical protein H6Q90_1871 [Deltaproteobacteria bacterium]|nr:hypothetical protein [Deltaproteobacteria bacterium]